MSHRSGVDFTKLIPELSLWNNGAGISPEAWVSCSGSVELAVGYTRLFWPDFLVHDDCVFVRADFSAETFRAWHEQFKGDRRLIESMMNHRHVFDYFSHSKGSATEDQIIYLGRVLKDLWEAKLARDFPQRRFVVNFTEGPVDDLLDYQVNFWQE